MAEIGSTSVRLNRKSWILGPFAHRAIVEREVVVTELVQEEEVDCSGDAATAIADDLFFFRHAACFQFCGRVGKVSEAFGCRIDESCR